MRYLSIFFICFIFSFLSNAKENVKIIDLHAELFEKHKDPLSLFTKFTLNEMK